VIVRDGRVAAAGCVLPLSDSHLLHADLGTRHRAAVGMSEASDAIVVVVSEETGVISVAMGGMLKRHLAAQTLERLLKSELCPDELNQEAWLEKARRLKEKWKKGKEDRIDGK
jgi:diadenylate cyclase